MSRLTNYDFAALNNVSGLSNGAFRLFHFIAQHAGRLIKWVDLSHAYIARALGVHASTVKRWIAELEAAGLLDKRGNAAIINGLKVKIRNSYRLCRPTAENKPRKPSAAAAAIKNAVRNVSLWTMKKRSLQNKDRNIEIMRAELALRDPERARLIADLPDRVDKRGILGCY